MATTAAAEARLPTLTPELAEALIGAPDQLARFCDEHLRVHAANTNGILEPHTALRLRADLFRGLGVHAAARPPPPGGLDGPGFRRWLLDELHADVRLRRGLAGRGEASSLAQRAPLAGAPLSSSASAVTVRVRAPSGITVWGPGPCGRDAPLQPLLRAAAAAAGHQPSWAAELAFRLRSLHAHDPLPAGVPEGAELDLTLLAPREAARRLYAAAPVAFGGGAGSRRPALGGEAASGPGTVAPPRRVFEDELPAALTKLAAEAGGLSEELCAWLEVLLLEGDFHVAALPGIVYLEDGRGALETCTAAKWQYWWVDVAGGLATGGGSVWQAQVYGDDVSTDNAGELHKILDMPFPPLGFWRSPPPRGWLRPPSLVAPDLAAFFCDWAAEGRKPGAATAPHLGGLMARCIPDGGGGSGGGGRSATC